MHIYFLSLVLAYFKHPLTEQCSPSSTIHFPTLSLWIWLTSRFSSRFSDRGRSSRLHASDMRPITGFHDVHSSVGMCTLVHNQSSVKVQFSTKAEQRTLNGYHVYTKSLLVDKRKINFMRRTAFLICMAKTFMVHESIMLYPHRVSSLKWYFNLFAAWIFPNE